jgi:hypothetical protein
MKAFDWQLQKNSYIPVPGQIVDASLVPAPKQRNTEGEREAIKSGMSAKEIWPNEKSKACRRTPMRAGRSRSAAKYGITRMERHCP